MSTFAPPVRRGDFVYSSLLYADPGNNNRHPRASVAELAALLRPEAPNLYSNGRKPGASASAKDWPWHFYSAQLIHYGLPVTKEKSRAKIRLLDAMNQFKLEVPAWVLRVESELKKEWEAENRKMKKGAADWSSAAERSGHTDKAKASPSAPSGVNVTVNLSFSSGLSMSEQLDMLQGQDPAQKKPSPSKRKRADENTSAKVTKVKQESTPTKRVKKSTARREDGPSLSSPMSTPSRQRFKQEYDSPLAQRAGYTPSPRVKAEPYGNNQGTQSILLSGRYEVNCLIASDMFQDYDLDLTLAVSPSRDAWWATFRWGAWDGIIQMRPGPSYHELGQPCSLGWRLRDLETGQLKFGKRCTGVMTFYEDQTFTGALHEVPGAGTVEFDGTRLVGEKLEDDLQDEWDAFVAEAYGR